MRIFLSAGELSGDAYASALIQEVRKRLSAEFEGIGGVGCLAEGVRLHADSSAWGAISISQSLASYPRVVRGYYRAKAQLGAGQPGLFIPIDFGYVNVRLAREAKRKGWKVLYFVPPGSWRRDRQGKDLPTISDAIVTPFPWSADLLRKMGANAHWFGHPLKQIIADLAPTRLREDAYVAVLPGSRGHEVSENVPLIAQVTSPLPYAFGLAPGWQPSGVKRWLNPLPSGTSFHPGAARAVLAHAIAGIVCSGTATLEAALLRCPMVVIYRIPKVMAIESKLIGFRRPKFVALPNILLDRTVVPELVDHEATPAAVLGHLEALLQDGSARKAQLDAFDEIDRMLGPADAISRTADLVANLAQEV